LLRNKQDHGTPTRMRSTLNMLKVLSYQCYHDERGLQAPITKEELLTAVRDSFKAPDWGISEQRGELLLTHTQTQSEVKVEVHGEDIRVEYDDGAEEETYLVTLTSDCLAWKRGEHEHKQLMREVIKKLPWETKAGCHIEDGQYKVVYSSNMQRGFERRLHQYYLEKSIRKGEFDDMA